MTHREAVLNHLKVHGEITPMEALMQYGCFRLAAVICELRKEGMPIDTFYPPKGKQYAIYRMRKDGE